MSSRDEKDFDYQTLAEMPDDEVYLRLGTYLVGGGAAAAPEDPDRRRRFARKWVQDWIEEQRDAICESPAVVAFLTSSRERDQVGDYAFLVDFLVAFGLHGMPLAVVTYIIVRRGLDALCSSDG